MIDRKLLSEELVKTEAEVQQLEKYFEALYSRITSPASRNAADRLFTASDEEFRETYRPGKTESSA